MRIIYATCLENTKRYGVNGNYVVGANIDQGLV
jgi:hypothetical protein